MPHRKCRHCRNQYHWKEAFSKFGYDDGDGKIKTPLIAQILEDSGYAIKYSRWSPHNTIIYSIQKNGMEFMPLDNPKIRIGYDDPASYLPDEILDVLNTRILIVHIFH